MSRIRPQDVDSFGSRATPSAFVPIFEKTTTKKNQTKFVPRCKAKLILEVFFGFSFAVPRQRITGCGSCLPFFLFGFSCPSISPSDPVDVGIKTDQKKQRKTKNGKSRRSGFSRKLLGARRQDLTGNKKNKHEPILFGEEALPHRFFSAFFFQFKNFNLNLFIFSFFC